MRPFFFFNLFLFGERDSSPPPPLLFKLLSALVKTLVRLYGDSESLVVGHLAFDVFGSGFDVCEVGVVAHDCRVSPVIRLGVHSDHLSETKV